VLSVLAVGGQSPLESNTSQTDNFDFKPKGGQGRAFLSGGGISSMRYILEW